MKSITVTTHYGTDDPECECDYYEIVVTSGRKKIAHFGDWYHDKGADKLAGFIQGLRLIYPDLEVKTRDVADYKV